MTPIRSKAEFGDGPQFTFRKVWLVERCQSLERVRASLREADGTEVITHQPLAVYADEGRAKRRVEDETARAGRYSASLGESFIASQLWLEESATDSKGKKA